MELFTAVAAFLTALLVPMLIVGALMIISQWIAFEKAGEPGWAAIIPFYNIVVLLKLGSMHWAWVFVFVAMIIPILNFVAIFGIIALMIIVNIRIAKNFGQTGGFAAGLILLPVIFFPILAFSKKIEWTGELNQTQANVGNEFKEEKEAE